MTIEQLITKLQKLQKKYPNATIYFMDNNETPDWFETFFKEFNVNEEENTIEMLFDAEEEI